MTRRASALYLILFALPGGTLHAQDLGRPPLTGGVRAGPSMPINNYGDVLSVGVNVGVTVEGQPRFSPVLLRGDLSYGHYPLDSQGFSQLSGYLDQLAGVVNVLYPLELEPWGEPYVVAGAGGYYVRSVDTVDLGEAGRTTTKGDVLRPGLTGGLGLRLLVGRVQGVVELRIEHVFAAGADLTTIPLTVGVRF